MSCKVRHCRYPETHTTSGHKCGTCSIFGHGQVECGKQNWINNLIKFQNDTISLNRVCNIVNCSNPNTHNASAHYCSKCGNRHREDNCIIQSLQTHREHFTDDIFLEHFNQQQFIDTYTDQGPTIVPITLGMGCQLFVRLKDGNLLSLFYHSDTGYIDEEMEVYDNFILGCNIISTNAFSEIPVIQEEIVDNDGPAMAVGGSINNELLIQCPLCRTDSAVINIYGIDEECKICFTNKVERCFVDCGHACICGECLGKL